MRGGARRTQGAAVVAVIALFAATSCSSSSGKSNAGNAAGTTSSTGASSSTGAPSGGGKTITVGVIADITGLAASSSKTAIQGINAGVI